MISFAYRAVNSSTGEIAMIAEMSSGAPKIEDHAGGILMYAQTEAEADVEAGPHGFLLTPAAALTVAARLLAAASRRREQALPVEDIEATYMRLDDGDDVVQLTLTVEGAPLTAFLDLTKFAELAAGLAEVSRAIDRLPG